MRRIALFLFGTALTIGGVFYALWLISVAAGNVIHALTYVPA